MFSGDSAIVEADAIVPRRTGEIEEDGMIEMRDLTGWREKQETQQPPELETPIQEEIKELPEILIGQLILSDDEEDDTTNTTTDDSFMCDSSDNSWASININADGSINVDLSDGETDDIEDFISLLSESSTSANMTSSAFPIDETTRCIYESSLRVMANDNERPVVFTPIRDFSGSFSDIHQCTKLVPNDLHLPNPENPLRPSTPFRPKPINPSKGSASPPQVSVLKISKGRRHSQEIDEESRLRGGATIVAKLPQSRCLDSGSSRRVEHHSRNRRQDTMTKCSSDVASLSTTSTPRPHILSLGNHRVRSISNSSGQSSSEKNCCPYHIRVRKRSVTSESNGQESELLVSAPRCRCTDPGSRRRNLHSAASAHSSMPSRKPPTSARHPKKALSIEDAIIQLSKRSASPPSDYTASSSSSSNHKKLVHRTMSANRITDELRAKLGLSPPLKPPTPTTKPNYLLPYNRSGSYERINNGHAIGTQTLATTPARCFSDSHVGSVSKSNFRCSRCCHHCPVEEVVFTCDTCNEVQRTKNAFVLEIFADRAQEGEEPNGEHTTCYGVRVGAGLLPVVVMFVSLIICSVVLLSDSVMSSICGHYCGGGSTRAPTTQRNSVWGWLDRY